METSIPTTKRDKRQIKHSLLLSRLKASNPVSKRLRTGPTSSISTGKSAHAAASKAVERNRISKSANKNAVKHERRKRARNLAVNLGDMVDALPTVDNADRGTDSSGSGGRQSANGKQRTVGDQAKVISRARNVTYGDSTMSSEGIKRKAGFQQRMRYLSSLERTRFEANLAAMSVPEKALHSRPDIDAAGNGEARAVKDKTEVANTSGSTQQGFATAQQNRWAALRSHISQAIG